MKGREENKIKIDNQIKEKLNGQPKILYEYFAYLSNNGRDSAPTRRVFINAIIRFCEWLEKNGYNPNRVSTWKKITPGIINSYLLEIGDGVKPKTKADYHVQLKTFFTFLYNMDYIKDNFFEGNKVPKQKYNNEQHIEYLTKEEITLVRQYIKDHEGDNALMFTTIFDLICKTGIRVTALTEINIDDINIDNNSIEVTDKENYTRDIYLGSNIMNLIKEYYEYRINVPAKTDAFFISKDPFTNRYKRITYTVISHMVARDTEFTGKHITPHKLRDTCAMLTYEETHDIYLTGEVLGHKNFENTKKYAKVTEKRRREAADFLDKI